MTPQADAARSSCKSIGCLKMDKRLKNRIEKRLKDHAFKIMAFSGQAFPRTDRELLLWQLEGASAVNEMMQDILNAAKVLQAETKDSQEG